MTFLLIILIAGTLAVVIALLLKLKSTSFGSTASSQPSVHVVQEGGAERIVLLLPQPDMDQPKVVILDGDDYRVLRVLQGDAFDLEALTNDVAAPTESRGE